MRRLLIVIAAVLMVGAGAGVAYASIPGPGGVISGCYKTSTGMLIVIDSSASCPTGYTALNWNQAGPQGPAGPTGPTGPAGPQATAQDVTSQVTYNVGGGSSTPVQVQLDCPSGTLALNGGVQMVQPASVDPGATLTQSGAAILAFSQDETTDHSQALGLPRPVNSGASWKMLVNLLGAREILSGSLVDLPITVTYYAICE